MLADLHGAIQRLVHERGLVPAEDVDVRFDAPRRDWVGSLIRPTLDFFLFQVEENTDLRHTNLETTRGNGRAQYRVPPRRFDLHYLVSALTSDVADEHLLLWRALVTLMKHPELPGALLPEALRAIDPPIITQVKKPDDGEVLLDVWSGLELPPRPALLYVVTVPVDLEIAFESPLVLTRSARYHRTLVTAPDAESRLQIGGVVRNRKGAALAGATVGLVGSAKPPAATGADGTFVLTNVPAGPATLEVSPPGAAARLVKVEIPSESYEIVVD